MNHTKLYMPHRKEHSKGSKHATIWRARDAEEALLMFEPRGTWLLLLGDPALLGVVVGLGLVVVVPPALSFQTNTIKEKS